MSQSQATLTELESKALALPKRARVHLVSSLVRSLTAKNGGLTKAWLDEAERRDREMGEDPEAGIPAEEVLRKARASLG